MTGSPQAIVNLAHDAFHLFAGNAPFPDIREGAQYLGDTVYCFDLYTSSLTFPEEIGHTIPDLLRVVVGLPVSCFGRC